MCSYYSMLSSSLAGLCLLLSVSMLVAARGVSVCHAQKQDDEKYRINFDKSVKPDQWDKAGGVKYDDFKQQLFKQLDGIKPDVAASTKGTDWKKDFIPNMSARLTDHANRENQQWSKEYIDLVKQFHNAQIQQQKFQETVARLNNSLQTYRVLQERLLSVEEVYIQNLKGVATTFLVLGSREWDFNKEAQNTLFNTIVVDGKDFIRQQVADNTHLIFSDATVQDTRLRREVIRDYSGGQVEELETDPVLFTDETTIYAVQQYRVYPEFPRVQSVKPGNTTGPPKAKALPQDTRYLQLTATTDGIPARLHAAIADRIKRVEEMNIQARERIVTFENQYRRDVQPIDDLIVETRHKVQTELNDTITQIQQLNSNIDIRDLRQSVMAFLGLGKMDVMERTPGAGDSLTKQRHDTITKNLYGLYTDRFIDSKKQAEEILNAKSQKRKMIIFTVHSEFLRDRERASELMPELLKRALEKLESRKERLVAYEFAVAEDGQLTNNQAGLFYDAGAVIRYLMPSPILSFQKSVDGGGDTPKLSILVALQIEYSKKDPGAFKMSPPAPLVPPNSDSKADPGAFKTPPLAPLVPPNSDSKADLGAFKMTPTGPPLVRDPIRKLEWFIEREGRCGTFPEVQRRLLSDQGFHIPTLQQLKALKMFLEAPESMQLRKTYSFLFASQIVLWGDETKQPVGHRATFQFANGATHYHDESFCGWLAGVRMYQ